MDTLKIQEAMQAANKVSQAAMELLNDPESEGKAAVLVEELDGAAALFDELAEELAPTAEEEPEGEPEVAPEHEEVAEVIDQVDNVSATLREWAGLPPVLLVEEG